MQCIGRFCVLLESGKTMATLSDKIATATKWFSKNDGNEKGKIIDTNLLHF